ncbi:SRPBCC family protein [Streptomyces sp. CRN 30]|uniref:SRPBCC family protein n=1 Tax=Streptomyces sp. CRN 30 TaxID=3075613 RepID=UPI002A8349F9|nr:SRPBCC family protein [Streptomyces sp. CRN 30]
MSAGGSPLDGLKEALGGYLSAKGSALAERAGDQVKGLTGRLTDLADGKGGGTGGGEGDDGGGRDSGGNGRDGGGGGGGRPRGSVKATHIMETVDVGVPLRTVYDHWTRFEEFSDFTKGVRSVSKNDETTSDWNVKVGPSARGWKATVQEQVPDERIVWTSEGAKGSTTGVVTFHALAPSLTRIVVVVEYYPAGFFEKTGNLWRAQGRRLRLDLKHFARHVTLRGDEEVEGWRGEIREGEVVRSHEEALEDEENADADEYGDEDYDEYGDGDGRGGEYGDEDYDDEDEDDEAYDPDEDGDEDDAYDDEGRGPDADDDRAAPPARRRR